MSAMKLIKADHQRMLHLTGVPNPVHRPVDIDQSQTAFSSLRSLRIYSFVAGSIIKGHAEEDEVLIVVLTGSVHLTISESEVEGVSPQFTLSPASNLEGDPCVAYLPPNGAYQLIPLTAVEVAYVRAASSAFKPPTVFSAKVCVEGLGSGVVFEEVSYAQRLRARVVQLSATHDVLAFAPLDPLDSSCEALVHVRTTSARDAGTVIAVGERESIAVESWDIVCILPGESASFHIPAASSALLLVVLACP